MKKKVLFIITIVQFSYSQNTTKLIGFEREYYTNESIMSSYTDKLEIEFGLKNNYSLKSEFSMLNLNFLDMSVYDDESVQKLYSANLNVNKEIKFKKNWVMNLGITPQLRSNFTKTVNTNDFIFNGYIKSNKIFTNKSNLMIALTYGTLLGKPKPYLEFEYCYPINNKINLSVGFPNTYIEYNLNQKHSFSLQSIYEGYFTRVSENSFSRVSNYELLNYESLFISRINNAFIYKYKFTEQTGITLTIGKSFNNEIEIEESNNQTTKKQFTNSLTVSIGIKYNLN